jgi:modulator of FtsH protease HflK
MSKYGLNKCTLKETLGRKDEIKAKRWFMPLLFPKTLLICHVMENKMTEWRARFGVFLNEAGGPWGGGKGSGGGSDGGSGGGSGGGGNDGGKGGGPRNPWQLPPGGKPRGPKGPSPFDQFKKIQDQFGGGGGNAGPAIRLALMAIIGLWLILTCVWRISPQESGVVTQFGAYSRTLPSGIGFTLPWPIEKVTKVNVTAINSMTIPDGGSTTNFVLTGDQNIIDLDYRVRWKISSPEQYQFQIIDPEKTIREVADSAMRASISRVDLAGAIGQRRGEIAGDASKRMQEILNSYRAGILIEGVEIVRADPPKEVNEAFKDVTSAQQQAQSLINGAKGYAQEVNQRALGESKSFDVVYEQYKLAPGVTRRRMYYETMEQVLKNVDKTILETSNVAPYLPISPAAKRVDEPAAAAAAAAAASSGTTVTQMISKGGE